MTMIDAKPPYNFDADHIALITIDMQRDFCDENGYASILGNDVKLLAPCIPVINKLQLAFRAAQLPIIHTKECHDPDLANCPTAKSERGNPPPVPSSTSRQSYPRSFAARMVVCTQSVLQQVVAQKGIIGWTAPAQVILDHLKALIPGDAN